MFYASGAFNKALVRQKRTTGSWPTLRFSPGLSISLILQICNQNVHLCRPRQFSRSAPVAPPQRPPSRLQPTMSSPGMPTRASKSQHKKRDREAAAAKAEADEAARVEAEADAQEG